MSPSNSSYLSTRPIFHWRKGIGDSCAFSTSVGLQDSNGKLGAGLDTIYDSHCVAWWHGGHLGVPKRTVERAVAQSQSICIYYIELYVLFIYRYYGFYKMMHTPITWLSIKRPKLDHIFSSIVQRLLLVAHLTNPLHTLVSSGVLTPFKTKK